jgi:CheY-like chemotaxis protein
MGGIAVQPVPILLAEDEALLLIDFEQALTEAGYGVVAVSSGTKAIALLIAPDSNIQGIITDIRFREPPRRLGSGASGAGNRPRNTGRLR